jgi:hypothetical protein
MGSSERISRRRFLRQAGTAGAIAAAPWVITGSAPGQARRT